MRRGESRGRIGGTRRSAPGHAKGPVLHEPPHRGPSRAPLALLPGADSSGSGRGCIAQLVEQLTLNQRVEGSSPSTPTNQVTRWRRKPGSGEGSSKVTGHCFSTVQYKSANSLVRHGAFACPCPASLFEEDAPAPSAAISISTQRRLEADTAACRQARRRAGLMPRPSSRTPAWSAIGTKAVPGSHEKSASGPGVVLPARPRKVSAEKLRRTNRSRILDAALAHLVLIK